MLRVWLEEPPVLLAQTVNIVVVMLTVGVPEITPLVNVNPAGSEGAIVQVSTIPV